jgi:neutral ceramidase
VPHVLPLHLLNIGGVVLAGVPAEFTGMAGRRLKASLRHALGSALSRVAIANYSNGYSGYVTTREEYGAQHYEGASTLYGPATLEAYQQSFDVLAARLLGQATGPMPSESQEFEVPAIYMRP